MRSPQSFGCFTDRLPDACRELQRGDILCEIINAMKQGSRPAQRRERGETHTGCHPDPILLAHTYVDAIFDLGQVDGDRGSPPRNRICRTGDLHDPLVSLSDDLG